MKANNKKSSSIFRRPLTLALIATSSAVIVFIYCSFIGSLTGSLKQGSLPNDIDGKSAHLRQHKTIETIIHSTELPPIISIVRLQSTEVPVLLPTSKPKLNDIRTLLGQSTVLLVICSSRPEYLQRSLSYIVKYHPGESLPIIISQDGRDERVVKVINEAKKALIDRGLSSVSFTHITHDNSADFNPDGYYRLCSHYKFALSSVFASSVRVKRVIILEEDLHISPDFFEFFASTVNILDDDPSLLGVSAWNDNGMSKLVRDEKQLYRSDFFPGLGWMMNRRVWEELAPKWPKAYWDDWLREPKQRQGRHIIRPEVCRTFHFGAHGVSNAQYSEYLNSIKLNDIFVPFTSLDLSYLERDKWDAVYLTAVRDAPLVTMSSFEEIVGQQHRNGKIHAVRLEYSGFEGNPQSFSRIAAWSGAMDNVKANVPRTAYKGIVSIWRGDIKLHITPRDFL